MEYKIKYKVKYEDNNGVYDCIIEFDTEKEAEKAIEEDLDNCKKYYQFFNYDYADFGNKTKFWIPDSKIYASWERMWKE